MKKLLIINPNSSIKMSNDIKKTLEECKNDYDYDVIRISDSPNVLESFNDYYLASAFIIKMLKDKKIDVELYDGVLIACFGDPGIFAFKELLSIPVIGIAEAAFSTSLLLGYKFSIVCASKKAKPMMESLVDSYLLKARLSSIESMEMNIENFINNKSLLEEKFSHVVKKCKDNGAEVIIMGCAGMTMLDKEFLNSLNIPIIDPIVNGVELLSSLVNCDYKISKQGLYK